MKYLFALIAVAVMVFGCGSINLAGAAEKGMPGEAGFNKHCSVCHPEGGNIVNPKKTLHKGDREANGIKTAADIVSKMRNPGPGMTKFDTKTVPDSEARKIAGYILKTFK